MHNKKIIAKGVVVATALSNLPIDSLANTIEEYKIINTKEDTKENNIGNSIKKFFAKIVEPIEDSVSKPKEVIKVNPNVRTGTVLEIRLTDSTQFVQDLSGNPGGYETVRVTTEGGKKLVERDYNKLRLSGIPKVDLSGAQSDAIPAGAFGSATHLTEFKFPQGIKSISLGASTYTEGSFYNCENLTGSLTIPNSVTTIGDYAFSGCNGFNGNLTISNSVTSIGTQAFYVCSGFTGSLTIPDSVTSIGNNAFNNCRGFTGSLTIPNSVTTIGDYAFYGCSGFTGSLTIPDSVTTIGNYAFRNCSGFTGSLTIPDSVTSIGDNAFRYCSGLTGNLTIPNKVTSIGNSAFSGCDNIEKIIVGVNKSDEDLNYREDVIKNLPASKTHIEISYNVDISNTWLNSSTYIKVQPTISTYAGTFENNEGMGISLEVIEASPIKTLTILKDGESYNLEKSENGKYMFSEPGDYQVYVESELGTISNIEFKNISPINSPGINIIDNNLNIVNNGILVNSILENFYNPDDLKFSFSNSNWIVENGTLKSETINDSSSTENEFTINAEAGDKLQISVKTSSENNYDWGYIYLNGSEVYKKSGTSTDFEVLEFDLQEGENNIKFKYSKDSGGLNGDDAMSIDYIKVLKKEVTTIDCDTLEYRIDGGDWQTYTGSFELNYPAGTKVQVEVRASHDGFTSTILSQEVTVELNIQEIEDVIKKAEQSKDIEDISNARDMVNAMPESSKKDEFQDRLNNIISNNIILEKKQVVVSSDIYIKFKNSLALTVETNNILFDDFDGTEDVERLRAINLTVTSSLPYKINAYLADDIKNLDGTRIVDKNILNIRATGQMDYNVFKNTTSPIVLLDNQSPSNHLSHGIDLMLKGKVIDTVDVYKAVIKLEIEQN